MSNTLRIAWERAIGGAVLDRIKIAFFFASILAASIVAIALLPLALLDLYLKEGWLASRNRAIHVPPAEGSSPAA